MRSPWHRPLLVNVIRGLRHPRIPQCSRMSQEGVGTAERAALALSVRVAASLAADWTACGHSEVTSMLNRVVASITAKPATRAGSLWSAPLITSRSLRSGAAS